MSSSCQAAHTTSLRSDYSGNDYVDNYFLPTVFGSDYVEHRVTYSDRQRAIRKAIRKERWMTERVLGSGGFGVVKLQRKIQRDGTSQRLRAVKQVPHSTNSAAVIDPIRELIAMAALSKEESNFVTLYGWYKDTTDLYIAMEYFELGDLQRCVSAPLPERECQDIVFQVTEALKFMHDRNFAHRDLKPSNIFVARTGPAWWVKVADFGISKKHSERTTLHTSLSGENAFASPELTGLTEEASITNAVDLWSLGCVATWLATQTSLFKDARERYLFSVDKFVLEFHQLANQGVSQDGIEFVSTLLQKVAGNRMTAAQALEHPWLSTNANAVDSDDSISSSLYQATQRAKSMQGLGEVAHIISATDRCSYGKFAAAAKKHSDPSCGQVPNPETTVAESIGSSRTEDPAIQPKDSRERLTVLNFSAKAPKIDAVEQIMGRPGSVTPGSVSQTYPDQIWDTQAVNTPPAHRLWELLSPILTEFALIKEHQYAAIRQFGLRYPEIFNEDCLPLLLFAREVLKRGQRQIARRALHRYILLYECSKLPNNRCLSYFTDLTTEPEQRERVRLITSKLGEHLEPWNRAEWLHEHISQSAERAYIDSLLERERLISQSPKNKAFASEHGYLHRDYFDEVKEVPAGFDTRVKQYRASAVRERERMVRQKTDAKHLLHEKGESGSVEPAYQEPERRQRLTIRTASPSSCSSSDNEFRRESRKYRRSANRNLEPDLPTYRNVFLQDDPFGSTPLFTLDGKPIPIHNTVASRNADHAPLTQREELIVPLPPRKKGKIIEYKQDKRYTSKDNDIIDLDALFGSSSKGNAGDSKKEMIVYKLDKRYTSKDNNIIYLDTLFGSSSKGDTGDSHDLYLSGSGHHNDRNNRCNLDDHDQSDCYFFSGDESL